MDIPVAIHDVQQVLDLMDAATEEILLIAPGLTARPVAEALRRAQVERRLRIYLLVNAEGVTAGGSFIPYLTLLDIPVRLLESPTESSSLLIDRRYLVDGALVVGGGTVFNEGSTRALDSTTTATARATRFLELWHTSTPFSLTWEMMMEGNP